MQDINMCSEDINRKFKIVIRINYITIILSGVIAFLCIVEIINERLGGYNMYLLLSPPIGLVLSIIVFVFSTYKLIHTYKIQDKICPDNNPLPTTF